MEVGRMTIIVETTHGLHRWSNVSVPEGTVKHIAELQPVLSAATKRPTLTLAEVILMLVETQTGVTET
jgi:hypothetical protein